MRRSAWIPEGQSLIISIRRLGESHGTRANAVWFRSGQKDHSQEHLQFHLRRHEELLDCHATDRKGLREEAEGQLTHPCRKWINLRFFNWQELDKRLSINVDDATNVLSVSFTDIDPEFAQRVVAFAVDLLVKEFYAVSEDDNATNLKNYQEAMDASFQKIVQYQKDLQELEQSVSNSSATLIPSRQFLKNLKNS